MNSRSAGDVERQSIAVKSASLELGVKDTGSGAVLAKRKEKAQRTLPVPMVHIRAPKQLLLLLQRYKLLRETIAEMALRVQDRVDRGRIGSRGDRRARGSGKE